MAVVLARNSLLEYTLHRSKKESFFMWRGNIQENILYEDSQILVCHKPAGLAVQNARVGSMDMESLLKNYIAQKVPGKMPYLGIIHRLDQPVEGVLVFALNPKAAADLSRQMTAGKIKKTYLAVTEGTVKVKSAKLVDWLREGLPEQKRRYCLMKFWKPGKIKKMHRIVAKEI